MKPIKRFLGLLQDYPVVLTMFTLILVFAHWALVISGMIQNPWGRLLGSPETGIAIYLGAASAAAIVAGFAGVVVVFGLTAGGQKFRQLRLEGSKSLARNWTSASVSGFGAAGLSLAAAVLAGIGMGDFSPWLFEWSILLLIHGTLRIIWLLQALMKVVHVEDALADRESKTRKNMTHKDFS